MAPRWLACAVAATGAYCLSPEVALACSRANFEPAEYAIDPSTRGLDGVPPSAFTQVQAFVSRRKGTLCENGQCTENSCGDGATVEIDFVAPQDDRTAPGDLGYRIEWIDGDMPASMQAMIGRRWPLAQRLAFDIGYEEAAAIDATIALVAIDRAGNESAPSEPIELSFSGCTKPPVGDHCLSDDWNGCAAGAGRPRVVDGLAIVAALFLLRRRAR